MNVHTHTHTTEEERKKDVDLMSAGEHGDKRFLFVNWLVLLLDAISLLSLSLSRLDSDSGILTFPPSLNISLFVISLFFSWPASNFTTCVNSRQAETHTLLIMSDA